MTLTDLFFIKISNNTSSENEYNFALSGIMSHFQVTKLRGHY